MRILHLTNVDAVGGTNTNCLQFLQASKDDNHLAVLDEPGAMEPRWRRIGIEAEYLRCLQGGRREFVRRLHRLAAPGRFDLILLWGCIRVPLIRFALRDSGSRLGIHLGNPRSTRLAGDWFLRLQSRLLPSAVTTRLFSCSEHVLRSHASGYWRQFRNEVIYNPVEIPRDPLLLPAAGHSSSRPRLGMVARLDLIKDQATLIRAAGILRERGVALTLDLVGDGPERSALEQLVTDLALGETVNFRGHSDDVYAVMRTWTLFLYATTRREGLGNAVVEALAVGLPGVVADLPMLREIDAGRNLLTFFRAGDASDCADRISAALADGQLHARVGEAGRQWVRTRHDPAAYTGKIIRYLSAA